MKKGHTQCPHPSVPYSLHNCDILLFLLPLGLPAEVLVGVLVRSLPELPVTLFLQSQFKETELYSIIVNDNG